MPSTNLRSALNDLANTFASSVLEAIRGASLEDLIAEGSGGGPRGRRGGRGGQPTPSGSARKGGRLARRSPDDIAKSLAKVVTLVKGKKAGLRSEQIRDALKLDKRELPRVLGEGLKRKVLKSKGQKRATTYFAA